MGHLVEADLVAGSPNHRDNPMTIAAPGGIPRTRTDILRAAALGELGLGLSCIRYSGCRSTWKARPGNCIMGTLSADIFGNDNVAALGELGLGKLN
jgi:hypothetical protein